MSDQEIVESPRQRIKRILWGTYSKKLASVTALLFLIALVQKFGSRLANIDVSSATWGTAVAGGGGGLLTWVTSVSNERIRKFGIEQTEVNAKGSAFLPIFTLLLTIWVAVGYVLFTFKTLLDIIILFKTRDIAHAIYGLPYRTAVFVLVTFYPAIVLSYVFQGWHWLDKVFGDAIENPDKFKKDVTTAGYWLLFIGTMMQFFGSLTIPK